MAESPFANHSFNLLRRVRREKRPTFALQLTSMIDMFTILLVFLLKSFSAEGQMVTLTRDLRLPESSSQQAPRVLSVIAVTQEWILLDGRPVIRLNQITPQSPLVIAPLREQLLRLRSISEGIASLSADLGFRGSISIQADRDLPCEILKRIMVTAGQVGYANLHLTVLEKEK
ncbi:MAG: biopolymer transporter ExbD [candidate division KSB1 bacterium]|nr:biopolymer transporter ExbD [candidate division KSB1 bacterium]